MRIIRNIILLHPQNKKTQLLGGRCLPLADDSSCGASEFNFPCAFQKRRLICQPDSQPMVLVSASPSPLEREAWPAVFPLVSQGGREDLLYMSSVTSKPPKLELDPVPAPEAWESSRRGDSLVCGYSPYILRVHCFPQVD